MLAVDQAVAELRSHARVLTEARDTALPDGLGRVLAEDIIAPLDVPPADNSAMDGYAFRHRDWSGASQALPVSQRIVAGQPPEPLAAGTAARIFTGAEIPPGADTVVMQEHCVANDGAVTVQRCPARGANIRPRAQDIGAGQQVLSAGCRLRAQELGLVASLGISTFRARRPLRVAIISNGSELVEPGRAVRPGQIYNSNRYLLEGLVRDWGFEPLDFGIAPDDPEAIRAILGAASAAADVILSSGGVSVGEEDHIKDVVSSMGEIQLWKVRIKPGKPFAFGNIGGTPFLGLPGNPSSVLVTSLVIARPFLFDCQGIVQVDVEPVRKTARFERAAVSREEYLRARSVGADVECYPRQSSGILLSTVWGDGLVVQREGQAIRRGEPVDFLPYALLS